MVQSVYQPTKYPVVKQGRKEHQVPFRQAGRYRKNRRVVTKNRSRFLLGWGAAILVALLVLTSSVALARQNGNRKPSPVPATVVITVRAGDTLWKLARRYGDPQHSQLDRMDELAAANDLTTGATVYPGQRILVPVSDAAHFAYLRGN